MRYTEDREEAEEMIMELEMQNSMPDLAEEQIEENNLEINKLQEWLQ